jgi:hypothetical protein
MRRRIEEAWACFQKAPLCQFIVLKLKIAVGKVLRRRYFKKEIKKPWI